jgi:hypothetical protein
MTREPAGRSRRLQANQAAGHIEISAGTLTLRNHATRDELNHQVRACSQVRRSSYALHHLSHVDLPRRARSGA